MSRSTRTLASFAAVAALSLGLAVPASAQDTDETKPDEDKPLETKVEMTKGEKRLAKMLEGRVAGEPTDCIRTLPTERSTTIDRTAYVYGRGNTIYVQRTKNPEQIRRRDALIIQRLGAGTQLCKLDIATTVDPVTGIFTGAVFFDDFIPYTRVKDADEG